MNDEIKQYIWVRFLIKLFFICVAVAPFTLAVINTGAYVFGYSYAKKFLLVFLIFSFLLIYFFYLFFKNSAENINKKTNTRIIFVIFLGAFILRLTTILVVRTQPVSDFFMAYDNATKLAQGIIDTSYQARYAMYHEWGFYSVTLAGLFKIFSPSVFVVQVFNCILGSATACFIYVSVKKLLNSYKTGIVAAILFIINPTVILYTGVLTGEHIVIFFSSIFIYLFTFITHYRKLKGINKNIIKYYILLGIITGLIGAYRPIGFIYLVAFFIVEFMVYATYYLKELDKFDIKVFSKKMLVSICVFAIVFASNNITGRICDLVLKSSMRIEEFDNRASGYGYAFYTGLGIDENGNNSKQVARDFRNSYTGPAEEFSRACYDKVLSDIKEYYYKYPGILWEKFSTAWAKYGRYPESAYIEWSFYPEAILDQTQSEQHQLTEFYYPEISTFLGQYYLLFMLLAAIGLLSQIKYKINSVLLLNALVVFGFMLVMLLGETQGRYRSVLFAIISIFSGLGIKYIIELIDNLFNVKGASK